MDGADYRHHDISCDKEGVDVMGKDHWGYDKYTCPKCDAPVIEGQNYCQECGHKLFGKSVFAKRLMMLRAESGESQADIARETGVSMPAVNRWENGNRTPRSDSIVALCKHYNVSADWLLGLSDERRSE